MDNDPQPRAILDRRFVAAMPEIVGCKGCCHQSDEHCQHPKAAMPDFINGGRYAPLCNTVRACGPCGVEASLYEAIP